MSMIFNLHRVSDSQIEHLLKNPEEITPLIYPNDGTLPSEDVTIDIDKSWHGLHFSLCGQENEGVWPEGFILSGGPYVGDVDVGYGAARAISSNAVAEISAFLESVDQEQLRKTIDLKRMTELGIYPTMWDSGEEKDSLIGYLIEYLSIMTTYVSDTAKQKMGLLLYLN